MHKLSHHSTNKNIGINVIIIAIVAIFVAFPISFVAFIEIVVISKFGDSFYVYEYFQLQ